MYRMLFYDCQQYLKRKKIKPDNLHVAYENYMRNKLIEQSCIETDDILYPFILISVTEKDISYDKLKIAHNIPCYEKEFEKKRRKFYHNLAKKMNLI